MLETKIVNDKVFDVIKNVVNKMVDMIRPTFGPSNSKVIISKTAYSMIVDDGVQIARDFELDDPVENAIARVIKETAIKTNDRVGDGTTGALIMLQSIINEVARHRLRGRDIEIELKKGLSEVKEKLLSMKRPIKTKDELKKVAMISFDDEKIADMLSTLYFKLGSDATITVDKSSTMDTYVEMSDGIKIGRGYISPYMITNPDRMETVIEKPYILITDYRMTEANDIIGIMNKMAAQNKRELVIICDNMEQSALATAVLNKVQGKFLVVAVNLPQVEQKNVYLEDIALMTGAKVFTESKGDKLESANVEDLGRAERFICRRDESIIISPKGKKSAVQSAINALQSAVKAESNERKKKELAERLGMFTNSLAVIKVGALTENEQKALKYKVEDAVNAVKSAYKHGVVRGAGLALASIKTSSPILNEALKYPARQLYENMDFKISIDEVLKNFDSSEATNLSTGEFGNFMQIGVIDPVEVLIAGVESAVSIASILVTSHGMIVEHVKKPPVES